MSRYELNKNLAQMLKGGVIMDVTTPEQQDEPTEYNDNLSGEKAEDKQKKTVIRTERPPQEVQDNE